MRKEEIILAIMIVVTLVYFILRSNNKQLKNDLDYKNHPTSIDQAAYELGRRKDTSAIKSLLQNSLDPRMSTNLKFKGFSVNYFRISALQEISGLALGRKIDQFGPDTSATIFYLNWAIKKGFIKKAADVSLKYLE